LSAINTASRRSDLGNLLADGAISRVAVQRVDFRGVLANGGGAHQAQMPRETSDLLSAGNLA